MTIPYWPETLPVGPATGLDFSPVDVRATFEADIGEPISRPRSTGAPFMANMTFTLQGAQIATFEAFYATTLGQGAQRFAMREVISGDLRMWRFMGGYSRRFPIKTVAIVQAQLMMLPGVPWFAPYARAGLSTVPYFVADYANGVYGIDGLRVTAADMPTVGGTYLVRRTTTATITEGQEVLNPGDITEAQPAGTTSIVGYSL